MNSLRSMMLMLWFGGLWTMLLVIIPSLFSLFELKQAAEISQRLMLPVSWVGFACASFVLIDMLMCFGLKQVKRVTFLCASGILAANLVNYFLVTPILHNVKRAGMAQNTPSGLLSGGFDTWHAISMGLFLLQCILGLVFLISDQGRHGDEEVTDELLTHDSARGVIMSAID